MALLLIAAAQAEAQLGLPVPSTTEAVPTVQQPNPSLLPVFSSYFDPPAGTPGLGSPTEHVAVTAGGDPSIPGSQRVYAVDEGNGTSVLGWRYDAATTRYVPSGGFTLSGNGRPRGIAYYRGELYVGDGDHRSIQVYRLNGTSFPPMREIGLPAALRLTDGLGATQTLSALQVTGIDVAWQEVWASFAAGPGGRVVVAFDAVTGVPKAALWHLARYECEVLTRQVLQIGSPPDVNCDAARHDGQRIVGACVDEAPTPELGKPLGASRELEYYVEDCKATVAADTPLGADVWDIAVAPEIGAVLSGCRIINRSALMTSASIDDVDVRRDVLTPSTAAETRCDEDVQDGVDAVWGMRWSLNVERHQLSQALGYHVRDYPIKAATGPTEGSAIDRLARSWSPQGIAISQHRDVTYQNRETRIDWHGDLKHAHWQRGRRCARYVVSDADILVIGARGEHWYEQARDFVKLEVLLDGVPISFEQQVSGVWTAMTSTPSPFGDLCVNLDAHRSGEHVLQLKATVAADNKTVTATNPTLRIDHDPPAGRLVEAETYVRGTARFSGDMVDPDSGPRMWTFEVRREAETTWHRPCPSQTVPQDGFYTCEWNSASGGYPDGLYRARAVMVDALGNSTTTREGVDIEVHNAPLPEEMAGPEELSQELDEGELVEDGPPDTESEPAPINDGAADSVAAGGDGRSLSCRPDDRYTHQIMVTYGGDPTIGTTAVPDPGVALSQFLAMGGVPAASFARDEEQGGRVLYVARVGLNVRAFAYVSRDPLLGWHVDYYEGCSTFPDEALALPGATP